MIEKIVSGGQTGVDQAGLLVAEEMDMLVGGWCPQGGLDEDGNCILDKYPSLRETSTPNPSERTKLNIEDSDGTLILAPAWPLPEKIRDGTLLTCEHLENKKKPFLVIDLRHTEKAVFNIIAWVEKNNIKILNIAGPRESNSPGVHEKSCELFRQLFPLLRSKFGSFEKQVGNPLSI